MKNRSLFFPVVFIFLCYSFTTFGQLSETSQPWSFTVDKISHSFQQLSIAPPEQELLGSEDSPIGSSYKPGQFARLLPVNLQLANCGSVEILSDGRKVWRLKLSLEGTQALSLYFTDFKLPENVKLFLYDEEFNELKGAYTSANNRESGLFGTSLIYSSVVILELNIPKEIALGNWFIISELSYADNLFPSPDGMKGFGTSDYCEVNINCMPEGDEWQKQKRGVVRIQIKANGGLYWCTGTMVNNTRYDNTPYLLTADHCAYKNSNYATVEDLEEWIFYFNYESETCENPSFEPDLLSLTGCEKIAHGGYRGLTGSDFFLVKLYDDIPPEWNVYFNGWSALDESSNTGVTIHHPDGDIKKISTYTEELTTTGWSGNGLPSHWRVKWVQTENNWGVTEGGSSGAPLYNDQGLMIGTLTGGLATCWNADSPDYYGKFSYHWASNDIPDTTKLKPWLDPDNTGLLTMDGSTMGMKKPALDENPDGMILYPNPVNQELNIRFDESGKTTYKIEVLNLLGGVIISETLNTQSKVTVMDVGHLQPGIYFVRKSGKGSSMIRKFIKR